jgi:tRNA modification GTPase
MPAPPADDTIVAICTPPGRGGIGAVRLSGPRAEAIALALFRPASATRAASSSQERESSSATEGESPGRTRYGRFVGPGAEPIDHGYLVVFRPPHSFTGEPSAELWAHGSPPVLRALVEAAVAAGARPATPGEFSLRAFLNGRIDATRAEAIRDLIAARTLHQARVAHLEVEGRLSRRIEALKGRLVDIAARLEATIEFSDEPEAARFLPEGGIASEIRAVRREMERLVRSFERGRSVREGIVAALAGAPNVGKSSLFNRLLEEDRAIVAAVPGTTRDLIEETIDLQGVPVTLVDTAGLHEARNDADVEAVRRARAAGDGADLLVLVLDWSRPLSEEERTALQGLAPSRSLVVLNKVDLPCGLGLDRVLFLRQRHAALEVSARSGEGIEDLRRRIAERAAPGGALSPDEIFLTNVRHRDLLERSAAALDRLLEAAAGAAGGEYLVLDLREAIDRLGEITGAVGTDRIYDRIFSTFCIGK